MAVLSARILHKYAVVSRKSIALLFVDVVNAFYSAARELILVTDASRECLWQLLSAVGPPPGHPSPSVGTIAADPSPP